MLTYIVIVLPIKEYGSTLNVSWAHAALSSQYKAFKYFSTNWLLKALLQDTPLSRRRFQDQGTFIVIISTRKVIEKTTIKKYFLMICWSENAVVYTLYVGLAIVPHVQYFKLK